MPSTRELARLFEAIADGSTDSSMVVARAIADDEGKKGHLLAAQKLRGALEGTGTRRVTERLTVTVGRTPFLSRVLFQPKEAVSLSDVQLRTSIRSSLTHLLLEFRKRPALDARGIKPRNKILFTGPPGCGKSMTARALATELGLPFYVVRLDAVIGAFLGQTASNLRELFAFAASDPCVLLIDEVDALGKQRGASQDVGELDRIVIAMLQELEFLESDGLLIATSNLQKLLDAALWRRFDLAISFPKPNRAELLHFAKLRGRHFRLRFTKEFQLAVSKAGSFAEAARIVEDRARAKVLGETNGSI